MIEAQLETATADDRFNMRALHAAAWPKFERVDGLNAPLRELSRRLGTTASQCLGHAILRHAFLIELVKVPKIETTKFRVRWFDQLDGDPRWCSYDECLTIAADIVARLVGGWLDERNNDELLRLCFDNAIIAYEAPIDYAVRPAPDDHTTRIHRRGNLVLTSTDTMLRTLKLRKFLTSASTSPDAKFFRDVLERKIYVKTYLTDRALTGDAKTNREKRWETHPRSVQFAERRTCMAIEYTLITQLCSFDGFPDASRRALQREGILPDRLDTFRCPITQEVLSFPAFRDALENPTHGKSDFQVGHLNPLKLEVSADEVAFGHSAENISWISADGNRIQGSMSLAEIRPLLRKIAANYEERGWV